MSQICKNYPEPPSHLKGMGRSSLQKIDFVHFDIYCSPIFLFPKWGHVSLNYLNFLFYKLLREGSIIKYRENRTEIILKNCFTKQNKNEALQQISPTNSECPCQKEHFKFDQSAFLIFSLFAIANQSSKNCKVFLFFADSCAKIPQNLKN